VTRTTGVFVETNSITEIPDGGSVRMEVFGENDDHVTDTPLASWPLSIQGGQFVIDIPQSVSAGYPDTSKFSLVATMPAGQIVRKLIQAPLGSTLLKRKSAIVDPSGTTINIGGDWEAGDAPVAANRFVNPAQGDVVTNRTVDWVFETLPGYWIHVHISSTPQEPNLTRKDIADFDDLGLDKRTLTHTDTGPPGPRYGRMYFWNYAESQLTVDALTNGNYVEFEYSVT